MDWRETDDPYRIWVSEIMLQQTRPGAVTPYYRRFLAAFPDLETLAAADPDAVLKAWEGLGYYSRARNLHEAARIVLSDHGGALPDSVDELIALPGIGRSTAGAIAAIAFRRDVPILDANAKRIVARLHAVRGDLRRREAERKLWDFSRRLILGGKGRETALALMDLGSAVCLPRNPRCGECPLAPCCAARRKNLQDAIPRKTGKAARPHRDIVAAVIAGRGGRILIGRRPDFGLLAGMWELPGGERREGESVPEALLRRIGEKYGIGVAITGRLDPIPHGYSHFLATLHGFRCVVTRGEVRTGRNLRWVGPRELERHAFPGVYRKLLANLAKGEKR